MLLGERTTLEDVTLLEPTRWDEVEMDPFVGEPTPLEGEIFGEPMHLGEVEVVDWKKLMTFIS